MSASERKESMLASVSCDVCVCVHTITCAKCVYNLCVAIHRMCTTIHPVQAVHNTCR